VRAGPVKGERTSEGTTSIEAKVDPAAPCSTLLSAMRTTRTTHTTRTVARPRRAVANRRVCGRCG